MSRSQLSLLSNGIFSSERVLKCFFDFEGPLMLMKHANMTKDSLTRRTIVTILYNIACSKIKHLHEAYHTGLFTVVRPWFDKQDDALVKAMLEMAVSMVQKADC